MANLNNGTFALDSNYDLSLDTGGNLPVISGNDTVIQTVRSALYLWRSEYEFNTTIGVNYKAYLGNFVVNLTNLMPADLRSAVLSITGVVRVISLLFNYDKNTNALQATIIISLINGQEVTIEF